MATSSQVQYAGETNLEYLRIYSSEGVRADLSSIVVEINLFEDIFSSAFTGNIIIVDTLMMTNRCHNQVWNVLDPSPFHHLRCQLVHRIHLWPL